jgi:hypothetical protein
LGDDQHGIVLHISIRVQDFAPQRLVCLAAALKQRYGDHKNIWCGIFSDRKIAERYVLLTSVEPSAEMARRTTYRHAVYSREWDQGLERLYINPDPLQDSGLSRTDTVIFLPVVGTPKCKIQLSGRCLLVLPTIWPFWGDPDENKESGSVTLEGKVAPSGRVGRIRIVESHVNPGESGEFLKKVAIRHLDAWRFESAAHGDVIQTTYQYRYTPLRPGERSYHVEVQMEQPDKTVTKLDLSLLEPRVPVITFKP